MVFLLYKPAEEVPVTCTVRKLGLADAELNLFWIPRDHGQTTKVQAEDRTGNQTQVTDDLTLGNNHAIVISLLSLSTQGVPLDTDAVDHEDR